MNKILFINPIHTNVFNEAFKKILDNYKSNDTKVEIISLEEGEGPCHLQYHSYEANVMPKIIRKVKESEENGYDGVVIGCFYDTALRASREVSEKMVVTAPAESSLHIAATLGDSIAIIVSEKKNIPEMRENARRYGFKDKIAAFKSVNLKVYEFQKDIEETKMRIKKAALEAMEENDADVIVLGCTAEFGTFEELQSELGVPVIDSGLAAFKYAEFLVGLKNNFSWTHSKVFGYASPPLIEQKEFKLYK